MISTRNSDLCFLSIEEAGQLLRKKKLSPKELAEAALARIELLDPGLKAFITVAAEQARSQAAAAEKEIVRGKYRGALHGIPVSLKDNIVTKNIRTTAGSSFFSVPPGSPDATVVNHLSRAGAVLIGKANLHEFAYGIATNNPHFGTARNPWDLSRIPGGSSGGSAISVSTGMCFGSIGTDTGGSVRIPSAFCGVVGLKPTFGRVSCFEVVPLARSLDHVGPIARSIGDAAILLEAIAGYDPQDPVSVRKPVAKYTRPLRVNPKRLKIGWPRDFFFDRITDEVRGAVEAARKHFESMGAVVREVSLPHLASATVPSMKMALAEAARYHESLGFYPARSQEYGEDLRSNFEAGFEVKAVDYLAAVELRETIVKEFEAALEGVDAILAPTVPLSAPTIGQKTVAWNGEEETVRAALLRLNRPADYTGHPAITIPCGFSSAGLPIGLQLIGKKWEEARLLQVAFAYEQSTKWHTRRPPIGQPSMAVAR